MNVYNEHFRVNSKFESSMKSKNNRIQRYKEPRGFPLILPASESALYSMDHDISLHLLEKFRAEKELEMKQNLPEKEEDDEDFDNSFDQDSLDDEMPFDFDATRERCSNTEKRTFKFEPLTTLNLVKGEKEVDMEMDIEEVKSDRENVREENKNNFGSISALFKSTKLESQTDHLNPFDSCESEGLRLQRTSNISCKATLPDNQMLRFSDLENMEDDFDMSEIPQSLSFKR